MGVADFLFNGSAPPSTTTYGSSSTSMPAWYNDYVQGLISKANAAAAEPYQAFTGARVATNQELPGVRGQIAGMQDQFNQNINPALSTMKSLQAPGNNALNQYGGMPMDAYTRALSTDYSPAAGLISQGSGSSMTPTAGYAFDQALGYNPYAAGAGYLGQSGNMASMAGSMPSTANINQYMNPYTNSVVNEIGRLGQQNLNKSLSNISDRFIGSGGFGGSRMGQTMGQAMRAANQDILGQQGQALSSGYGQALGASQADLNRSLQAAGQLGSLGSTAGSLAGQTQAGYGNLGQTLAGIQGQDLSRKIQAGQGLGSLLGTQQQNLGSLAQSMGAFGQSDLSRQLDAAKSQGALAQTMADQGIKNASALEAVGQSQAAQNQRQMDVDYQNFLAQRDYPKDQLNWLSNLIRGQQMPTATSTTATGPASTYQASPLGQIASATTGLAGLSKLFG